MPNTSIAQLSALALVLTVVASPLVLAVLRQRQILDRPNARSSHSQPTPRGGGVAPALAATIALIALDPPARAPRLGLLVAAVGFGLIGLVDDLRDVSPFPRLAAQFALALIAGIWLLAGLGDGPTWPFAAAASAVWLVGFVNAFNFMDGINGIATAQVVVAGVTWWLVGQHFDLQFIAAAGAVVAAAGVGFLPFNFPRAAVFLGDVGSYFLGGWLAALAIVGFRAGLPIEVVAAPLALFLADTGWTLVRRVYLRQPWYEAHRDHAYQRLTILGWSHAAATAFAATLMAGCALLSTASLSDSLVLRVAADAGIAVAVVLYLAAPTAVGRGREVHV
jgi:UDP-N-acetylmuramyl pentapeptide phosphotransferase/UDP-N-acetylglucosamine-1-phosphate transferase